MKVLTTKVNLYRIGFFFHGLIFVLKFYHGEVVLLYLIQEKGYGPFYLNFEKFSLLKIIFFLEFVLYLILNVYNYGIIMGIFFNAEAFSGT